MTHDVLKHWCCITLLQYMHHGLLSNQSRHCEASASLVLSWWHSCDSATTAAVFSQIPCLNDISLLCRLCYWCPVQPSQSWTKLIDMWERQQSSARDDLVWQCLQLQQLSQRLTFVVCRTWIRTERHYCQSSMDFTATRSQQSHVHFRLLHC